MDMIDKFLKKRAVTNKGTRKNYRLNIQTYFKLLNKDMNTYFPFKIKTIIETDDVGEKFEKKITIFLTPLEKYEEDLEEVYLILHKDRPLLSIRTFLNSVKQFMVANNKELKDLEFWDTLRARVKGAEPANNDAILNQKDIKNILSHGDACARAMYLMLASSGRRIDEILAITENDVHTDTIPTTITISKGTKERTTKTGQRTDCFISSEATEAYNAWLKERDEYLKFSCKKATKNKKDLHDPRVFPMSYSNALTKWNTLLMRAKVVDTEFVKRKIKGQIYDVRQIKRKTKGERIAMHPHCLRKFFRSYLGDADFAEYLMGHGTMLTRTYRNMKPEDKAEKYLNLMQNVTIFETAPDLTHVNEELEYKEQQMKEMQIQINDMKEQMRMYFKFEEKLKKNKKE